MSSKSRSLKRAAKASKLKVTLETPESAPSFTDLPPQLHALRLKLWRHYRAMVPCTEHECGGLHHTNQEAYDAWRDDMITATLTAHGGTRRYPTLSGIPKDVQDTAARVVKIWQDEPDMDSRGWEQWSDDEFYAVRALEDSLFNKCCMCCLDEASGVTAVATA